MRVWLLFIIIFGDVIGQSRLAVVLDLKALQDTLRKLGNPWIAGTTSVSELSPEEKRESCGSMTPYFYELDRSEYQSLRVSELLNPPSYWDWRNHNGHNWMTPVKNQGGCGSCWCFATIGGFEARIKIANNTPDTTPDLSEEFLTSCDNRSHGCHGGSIRYAAHFVVAKGIPDEECFPYAAKVLPCINACPDWEARVKKAKGWGSTSYVPEYKPRIMEGPMACWVTPKGDFFYYKGGVYTPIMGEKYIHAVTLCGWDDTLGAWIFKNSWGTTWGDSGYGYINYGEEHIVGPAYPTWLEVEPHKTAPHSAEVYLPPNIVLENCEFYEANDNIWDPGETVDIIVTLKNMGSNATNAWGKLSTTDTFVTVDNDSSYFGSILQDSTSSNSGSPYKSTASLGTSVPHEVEFNLHVKADGGYQTDITFNGLIGLVPGWVIDSFDAPGNGWVHGIAFDGTCLWVTCCGSIVIYKLDQWGNLIDMIPTPGLDTTVIGIDYDDVSNALWVHSYQDKKIYKIDTSGAVLTSFSSPATQYPTGLAFEPHGSGLIAIGSYFSSTAVWEIDNDTAHHFDPPGEGVGGIEVNPNTCEYWVNSIQPTKKIYRVRGFYRCPGVEENVGTRHSVFLQVFPNPSRAKVFLRFRVSDARKVSINVYDIAGKFVYCLVDEVFQPGNYKIKWAGRNELGERVSPGVYFFRLKSGENVCVKKAILL